MGAEPAILLAIKPLHYQGQQLLHENWSPFIHNLRTLLQERGFEDGDSNENLLLFTFATPYSAISTLSHFISKARGRLDDTSGDQALPIQIVVHLSQPNEATPPCRASESGLWELLTPEAIHVTKTLKSAWDRLMAQAPLHPCTFSNEGGGVFKLQFSPDDFAKTEQLLSCRAISSQGPERTCFYCGMQSHLPGQCPSKFLTMAHDGLNVLGYLPFPQLDQGYPKVFTNLEAMTQLLAANVEPTQVRKDPALIILVGFLDIHRIYQPRFLWNIAFSRYSNWLPTLKAALIQPDNKNLQLGLDCLRVGKYPQAEEFLQQECHAKSSRRFSGTVAMAFVALEQRGVADMRGYLEMAKSMATQPKERIYIDLLLSRFYDLVGETWKARDIVRNLLATQMDCAEAMYRKLQLEVKGNFIEEACQLLRLLIRDQRTLFMAALMDPALLPIQIKLDDMLSTQYSATASSAQDSMVQARQEITDLSLWLGSQDQQLLARKAELEALDKRFQRKSYFDVIDVEHKAKALHASVLQLKEAKLNELYVQVSAVKAAWDGDYRFWAGYSYQIFFKDFIRLLLVVEKDLKEAIDLAKKNEGETYQKSVKLLREIEQVMTELKHMRARMDLVNLFCDSTVNFSKKLALTELGGGIMATAILYGLGQLPEGNPLASMVSVPLFQKKVFFLTAVLLAPFLALTLTIKDQLQK